METKIEAKVEGEMSIKSHEFDSDVFEGGILIARFAGENHELNAQIFGASKDLIRACQRCIMALAANGAPNCEAVKEARAALSKSGAR